jgi:hypothetical protein
MATELKLETSQNVADYLARIDQRLAYIEEMLAHYEPLIAEAAARLAQPFWKRGQK